MKKICKMHKHERDHKTCDLHKARVDDGLSTHDKAYQRAERNNRTGTTTTIREPGKIGKLFGKKPEVSADIRHGSAGSKRGSAYTPGYQMKDVGDGVSLGRKVVGKPAKSMRKACELHKTELLKHACSLHKSEEHSVPETNEREGTHDDKDSSCPYCQEQNEDNRTDDCEMCQSLDAQENADGTAGMDDHSDCPMCRALDSEQGTATESDCPYCESETIEQANPENSEAISADDAYPSTNGPHDCPECQQLYGDAVEEQPGQTGQEPPKTQGHETAAEVLDMLDQEPGTGTPPAEEAKQIDNTELPQGDQMEEGTSVPENFGDAQKNDISDEEQAFGGDEQDQPDMADVLQSGLNDHTSEQKRAEVIDQVAQTLQGFKANKAFLEAAKEQSPGLYQSTIQMLKAMISLCGLLGLEPKMPAEQPGQEMPPQAAPEPAPSAQAPAEGQPDPKAVGRQAPPQQ